MTSDAGIRAVAVTQVRNGGKSRPLPGRITKQPFIAYNFDTSKPEKRKNVAGSGKSNRNQTEMEWILVMVVMNW